MIQRNSAWVFRMAVATLSSSFISGLVHSPVGLRDASGNGGFELQMGFDPCDVHKLVLHGCDASPKVAMAHGMEVSTVKQNSQSVMDIPTVRKNVDRPFGQGKGHKGRCDFSSLSRLV